MSEFNDLAYILRSDNNRFHNVERGEGYDVQAFSFDGVDQVRRTDENKVLNLPNPTMFYQHKCPEYLNELDNVKALEGCPIFSQKIIDVLLSIRDFKHRVYPIAVLKERGNLEPYKDIEKFKKLSLRDDLYIFQTMEFLDIFDWQKSSYEQDDYDIELNVPTYIRQFVLKEPDGGFPPLFRLLPLQSMEIFISKEAREALKVSGTKGLSFASLLFPMRDSEVDVPINEIRTTESSREAEKHQKRVDRVFTRAEEERAKGNDSLADRLEQEAHDLMRMSS
jgi:hypothetical protein